MTPSGRLPRRRSPAALVWALLACASCAPGDAPALPAGSIAFGVYGDGPYYAWEQGRWRRLLQDVGDTDIAWLLHVGDLFWYPCSEAMYEQRARELAAVPRAVVYTPGDNEWTDCWGEREGRYDPLERLGVLRRAFFGAPARSRGAAPMALVTQAADSAFAEFAENVRWRRGRIVFATLHVVGSGNGSGPFPGDTAASRIEAERRTDAALAWMRATFDSARAAGAATVVLAFHADVLTDEGVRRARIGYERFVSTLIEQSRAFPGQVVAIHGDSHRQVTDQPFRDANAQTVTNLTRVETYGSPDIGWLRVVMDTTSGALVRVEPRLMRGWW